MGRWYLPRRSRPPPSDRGGTRALRTGTWAPRSRPQARAEGIASFKSAGKWRRLVTLAPRAQDDVLVSQESAAEFRRWMERSELDPRFVHAYAVKAQALEGLGRQTEADANRLACNTANPASTLC